MSADNVLEMAVSSEPRKRDWFGYIFTTTFGLLITLAVAWYQSYASQKEAAAAELERAKAVTQSVVAIVEELVLNGKRLETTRLVRLIDKRRRDESISLPITVSDVVERAEFNIESSRYLSVEKKQEIKPIFDEFYGDLSRRAFRQFPATSANADVLNEIAGRIQEGKSSEALAALRRLSESQARELAEAEARSRGSFLDGIARLFNSPAKIILSVLLFIAYLWLTVRAWNRLRSRTRRRIY